MGSWVTYGLGSEAEDLPGFVVLTSLGQGGPEPADRGAAVASAASCRAGSRACNLRGKGDPVLYLSNPAGRHRATQQGDVVEAVNAINARHDAIVDDPEIATRIAPVRDGVPDAGQRAGADGHRATSRRRRSNCTAASRATARSPPTACWPGGWPSAACASSSFTTAIGTTTAASKTASSSRPRKSTGRAAALITDLKAARHARRHADRLGRRVRPHADVAGRQTAATITTRDSRSGWPAAACSGGLVYGATDELGYAAVENVVTVHDLHATMLHLLGIDHERFTSSSRGSTPNSPASSRPKCFGASLHEELS